MFGQLWLQICLIATLFLSSGEYFHILKIFGENEKCDQIQDKKDEIEKFQEKIFIFMEILMFGVKISII